MKSITVAENTTRHNVESWLLGCETRAQVAERLRENLPPRSNIYIGGHHVAVCNGSQRVIMVTGTLPDWR